MKKNILTLAALLALGTLQAQIRTANSAANVAVANSPAFIDASSNTTVNNSANVGKGLIFPRVDLSAMTAFPAVTAGIPNSFPTRFDGMIVYNTASSGTAGVGSTSGTLSPGFWYYENKSSTNTGGTWKPVSTPAAPAVGDNLGNHSATQNLVLNSLPLRLKNSSDFNHQLAYDSTVDGPRLSGASGGYLGTGNGTNALTWDINGNINSPGKITSGKIGVGNITLNPADAISTGFLEFNTANGTRMGFLQGNGTSINYIAENGNNHTFTGNLYALNDLYSGDNKNIHVRGNANGIFWDSYSGGWFMDNAGSIKAFNDKQIYTGGSIYAGNFVRSGNGVGNIIMRPGDAATTGFLEFNQASGTRIGVIQGTASRVVYTAENGTYHNFIGDVYADNQIYSGTDKWFRVRGSGSGIYWENFGGGWNMTDSDWIRAYGGKNIYTSGIGQFDTKAQVGTLGNITMKPGDNISTGFLEFNQANGTRLGTIQGASSNMQYITENGATHNFTGNIYANDNIYSGINQWFRVRGSGSGIYWEDFGGGWNMTDNIWIRAYGGKNIYTSGTGQFDTKVQVGGGVGNIIMKPGDAVSTGFLEFNQANGTLMGTIQGINSKINYVAGTGVTHNFTGNLYAESQVYSGVNQWFRVRGSGSGIYWEDFGGGWNMTDNVWIRAYGGKNIYTSGIGQFDTMVQTARVQGTSDIRFKKDIAKIYDATEKLNQLNGYTYTWRDKKEFPGQAVGEGKDMGVIAQEVEKVFPDAVMTNKDGYKSVNYNALIPVLIEALKESNQKIKALEERVNTMRTPAAAAAAAATKATNEAAQ